MASGPGAPGGAGPGNGRAVAAVRGGAPGVPEEDVARSGQPPSRAADAEPDGGLRGAGAELRHKLRTERRLRLVTLISLAALVLLVLPAFFGVRAMASDPVFASLNELKVDSRFSQGPKDQESGSAFCFLKCSFREREADSAGDLKETTAAYAKALTEAGWDQWTNAACEAPERPEEQAHTCWRQDELTLDLYVGLPDCAVDEFAAGLNPSAGAEAAVPADPGTCTGSSVRIKVQNTLVDHRGETDPAPGPLGQTPETVLPTDDPLLQSTPKTS
ncbi:hypothetical protein [Actinoplanes utahensis]|uniref:hypothetical protein n=1 Tax=Actinoplanes utahensis TaxID=1869 RepID=UPI00068A3FF0|nr:hypothetical protein [Actinoplanes utahensis]